MSNINTHNPQCLRELSDFLLERHKKGKKATDSEILQYYLKTNNNRTLYLIIVEDHNSEITFFKLYPREWLNNVKIPKDIFHKPDPNVELQVLKRGKTKGSNDYRNKRYLIDTFAFEF